MIDDCSSKKQLKNGVEEVGVGQALGQKILHGWLAQNLMGYGH